MKKLYRKIDIRYPNNCIILIIPALQRKYRLYVTVALNTVQPESLIAGLRMCNIY